MTAHPSHLERFWKRVDRRGPAECWPWLGALEMHGYGQIMLSGKRFGAHRAAWLLLVGEIPEGFQVDHLCRNRACVNPAHMELVTPRENTLRGEGITAKNARRTHCKRGHLLDKVSNRGWRFCGTCSAEAQRRYQQRRREAKV